MRRHHREAHTTSLGPILQAGFIPLPHALPRLLNLLPLFELRPQKRCEHVRRQVAGPKIDPRVLVHLSSEEPAAVRALLANDFRAFDEIRLVDQQRTALPAGDVLGLVKALRRQCAERSQETSAVGTEQAVCVVFHNRQTVASGNGA